MDIIVEKTVGTVSFVCHDLMLTDTGYPVKEVVLRNAGGFNITIIAPVSLANDFAKQVGQKVLTFGGPITAYSMAGMEGCSLPTSNAVLVTGYEFVS